MNRDVHPLGRRRPNTNQPAQRAQAATQNPAQVTPSDSKIGIYTAQRRI